MTCIIALSSATSVSGLNCRKRCAWRASSERRGSQTISLVPLSAAFLIQLDATGWFTLGLAPMMMTTSALATSITGFETAPEPMPFEQRGDARRVAQPRAMVDVVAAKAGAHQLLEQVGLFVAALGRAEAGERLRAVRVAQPCEAAAGELERLFPRRLAEDVEDAVGVHRRRRRAWARRRGGSAARAGAAGGARSRSRSGP